jgi:hypothetical protein
MPWWVDRVPVKFSASSHGSENDQAVNPPYTYTHIFTPPRDKEVFLAPLREGGLGGFNAGNTVSMVWISLLSGKPRWVDRAPVKFNASSHGSVNDQAVNPMSIRIFLPVKHPLFLA